MSLLQKYRWEGTHATIIAGVIITLTVVIHLTGTPRVGSEASGAPTAIAPDLKTSASSVPAQSGLDAHPVKISSQNKVARPSSDPRQVAVGPTGISNRYTLLSIDRKPVSSTLDQLTVRVRVESLATANLVSPFESDMLEIRSRGEDPINPSTPFRLPVPSGNTRDQDIVFNIPSSLNLTHASLQIHYFNYQNEIPLNHP